MAFQKKTAEMDAKQKKLISFTNFDPIIGMVQDMAAIEGTNDSVIIEGILDKELLPEKEEARRYVKSIYTDGLKYTFETIFANLSAGIDFKAAHDNGLPLVKFAQGMSIHAAHGLTGNEDPYHHFRSQCDSILRRLQHSADNLSFDQKEEMIITEELIRQLPDNFVPYNYYNVILANWRVLGNSTYTYRLLYDLVTLTVGAWRETSERRLEACKIISEVVNEWG